MSLPFHKEQIKDLVKKIAQAEALLKPWSAQDRRAHPRAGYLRANIAISVQNPNGSDGGTYLLTRNISAGGMTAWHRGYLYTGSACVVELPASDGDTIKLIAEIKNCRFMEGVLHESNISFREKIDLSCVLSISELYAIHPPAQPTPDAQAAPEPSRALAGLRVLITTCDEGVIGLVSAPLKEAGCSIKVVESLGQAFDELRKNPYDAVVCGDLVNGADRATMLLKLRTISRFSGRAVLAGFREPVASGLIAGDPNTNCHSCDPFDAESVVSAMPSKRKAA